MEKELIDRANAVNAYDFVKAYLPAGYVECGRGQIRLRDNNSVMISKCIGKTGKSGWIDWATGDKNGGGADRGNAVTFLIHFYGMSVPAACETVLKTMEGYRPELNTAEHTWPYWKNREDKIKNFKIPQKSDDNRYMFAYLCKSRGIPAAIIQELFGKGLIYQIDSNRYKNIVFLKKDATYYEVHSSNSHLDQKCKYAKECGQARVAGDGTCITQCEHFKGSAYKGKETCNRDKRNDFFYFQGGVERTEVKKVIICEAAIDAISLYAIHKMYNHIDTRSIVYVSIGGVNNTKPIEFIASYYMAHGAQVYIATDNDTAGERCANLHPELIRLKTPDGTKDWNELLQKMNCKKRR